MKLKYGDSPYLAVQDPARMMKGKGAPRSTVFGVLGRTQETGMHKVLGGLIQRTTVGAPMPEHMSAKAAEKNIGQTERRILGPASKTHIPGTHFAQIPYPGQFMSNQGGELS
jgi:hypothetical protein